jgi:Flp pilus assembly pilin Flp
MKWSQRIATFLVKEDGPTTVEYAVFLALLVGMMLVSLTYLGEEARQVNETLVNALDGALTK